MTQASTLGELKQTEWASPARRQRTVKDEMRENLICLLENGSPLFPGIVGYEETVLPQLVNAILSRVESVRDGHCLKRFDLGKRPSCIVLTPRFRTSRHIVALLIPTGAGEPKLVVKMPRLAGDDDGIAREARVLTALREKSPSASESIPEVVTCEDGDRPLLVETALVGPLMTRRMLRADPVRCVDTVVSWLISLPASHHGAWRPERKYWSRLSPPRLVK